jgi:hypothetical protein
MQNMMKAVPPTTNRHLQLASNFENFDETKCVRLNDNVWWRMETNIKGNSSLRSTRSWNYFKGGPSRKSVQRERYEGSQSRQRVKYRHESCGTRNKESLCWRGPAEIEQACKQVQLRHVTRFPVSIPSCPVAKLIFAAFRTMGTRGRGGNHRVRHPMSLSMNYSPTFNISANWVRKWVSVCFPRIRRFKSRMADDVLK